MFSQQRKPRAGVATEPSDDEVRVVTAAGLLCRNRTPERAPCQQTRERGVPGAKRVTTSFDVRAMRAHELL